MRNPTRTASVVRSGAAGARAAAFWRFVLDQLRRPAATLLPLRLFIGLGWLRAGVEKAIEPEWRDGTSLSAFLLGQLTDDRVAFPLYQALIAELFLPHALGLGWLIMLGQLLAGAAILSGTLTNLALAAGLFMNLNFLLAGVPDPSAFYIVIQAALLGAGAGAVLGGDALLSRAIRQPLLVAQPEGLRGGAPGRRVYLAAAIIALGMALYALRQVEDFSPAGSVEDPAMILTVLSVMGAIGSLIIYLQQPFVGGRARSSFRPQAVPVRARPAGWSAAPGSRPPRARSAAK
jgi:thiosulfate dehydrogenase (quinone) large subunit